MITTSDTIQINSSSIVRYAAPDIVVAPSLNIDTGITTTRVECRDSFGIAAGVTEYYYTKVEISVFTGSGSSDTDKYQNAVEKAVKDSLEALNGSATFTIV